MESTQIFSKIKKLHWSNTNEEIDKAIQFLVKLEGQKIKLLILPLDDKALWENAALVLKEIGYPRIKPIINEILIWLQDLNWPGIHTIIELLLTVEKSILIEAIENTLTEAIKENDKMWIDGIKVLVNKKKLVSKDFNKIELFDSI